MNEALSRYKVTDRQSFVRFINLLRQDLQDNPQDWENNTLSSFLEAFEACADEAQAYYDNTKQPVNADIADWQTFADILRGAVVYE